MTEYETDRFESPLVVRYAGQEMIELFSERNRTLAWRDLWIALAETQADLGLPIQEDQVAALRSARDRIDWDRIRELEFQLRHDVMAHVRAFGEVAPEAAAILHLGATSAFVQDNGDLLLVRRALGQLLPLVASVAEALADFARRTRSMPTLGFTHFQPAQPTTVGKRAALWLQDLVWDLEALAELHDRLPFRSVKGTTGTQASFLQLFQGDHAKVEALEQGVAERMGFDAVVPLSGQTLSRKVDVRLLETVAGLGVTLHKMGTDLRLLAHMGEVFEPFRSSQVGSSAMPYKRNPMRAERLCALSRHLTNLVPNTVQTAQTQWMERSLDDSANRRLTLPNAFLTADALLRLALNIARGLEAREDRIRENLARKLPYMATERILMAGVLEGGDRQELHERLREHTVADGVGDPEALLERLKEDPVFAPLVASLDGLLDPASYVGRAPEQVDRFLRRILDPALEPYRGKLEADDEIRV